MPIRLIRRLADKLSRKTSDPGAGGDDARHGKRMPGTAAPGSAAVAKGASTQVWRPGDPVPKVPSRNDSARSSTRSRPSRSSAPRRPPSGGAPLPGNEGMSGPAASAADASSAPGSRTGSGRRRSRGGRRKSTVPGGVPVAAGAAPASPPAAPVAAVKPVEPPASPAAVSAARPEPQAAPAAAPWVPADFVAEPAAGKVRFQDLGLPDSILHGVADLGFKYCTPIQARVLQEVAEGHNVAGKAQTGTGKTAAFLILTFKQFLQHPLQGDRACGKPRALILAPTRELVIQIARDAEDIGKYGGMNSMAVYGGADYDRQERELLRSPVDLIAATPGRLLDFRRKGTLDLSAVEVLVIDEADRMLDMGFIPDVKAIIRYMPPKDRRRTLLFSATLSDDVMRLASQWMPDPHVVEIEPEHVAVDTVKQLVYMVRATEKFTVLFNLLKRPSMGRVLVFANRRDQTDRIAFELKRYGIECEVLSGSVDQKKRMRVLDDFRSGKVKTVVATDVAGRGLHVDNIDHVVNFDLPYEAEDYVHRIGRTGRAGAEGTAVSFACEDESFGIPDIEKFMGEPLACLYPEDVLLKALPSPVGPAYVRPPRSGVHGSGGARTGGDARRRGPRRSGPRR